MTLQERIEKMSDEEKAQLLATEFDTELEKEAAAELAQSDLVDALYAYGAYVADREVESTEELSKEATAEFDAAHAEITAAIEQGLMETGAMDTDDTQELHKQAQVAAAIVFAGYTDQIEKLAADEGKMGKLKKFMGDKASKAKDAAKNLAGKAKGAAGKAAAHMGKHKGKYGAGAAALAAGAGALAYRKKMEKKAGEISYEEMREQMIEDAQLDQVVFDGIAKLAGMGEKAVALKGKAVDGMKAGFAKMKASKAGQHVAANKTKYMVGGAALGGAALGRASKKDK